MSAKRFKTLSGYVTNISSVKEGKKQHNWAEGFIQTGANIEEKVLFFFEKPKMSSPLYENAVAAYEKKSAVLVSGLSEDKEGVYLSCRTSEIKNRQVSFDFQEVTTNIDIETVMNNSTSDDTINISGRIVKLNPMATMMKYDNVNQQKVQKSFRSAVIADTSGALLVMLWEDIAQNVHEEEMISLSNMRSTIDGRGVSCFTTTFRSQLKSSPETDLDFDIEAAESLMNIQLTLFQEINCSIDSISVDLQITCPRCKTKTSSSERLVVCSNSSCGATFRSKATSVRVELMVTESDKDKQYQLVAYKDFILAMVGNTDQKSISDFFMKNDEYFKITFHCRSKVIEKIEKLN